MLQKLAASHLSDREWLDLTEALCRPFTSKKGAHPLPPLVGFFFEGEPAQPGRGVTTLRELLTATEFPSDVSEGVVYEHLLQLIPLLGRALRLLSFLYDYSLVVRRQDTERWMGTRRIRRLVQALVEPVPPSGVPALVDSLGVPVLSLSPLAQVFSPGGDIPEEMFFLEGAGRHGARMVALNGPFERQSADVWPWFSSHLAEVSTDNAQAREQQIPYKGLSTFTAGDADNFFGREKEAQSFANRLKNSPFLAVVGPSGAGKSSFVLAGVIPLLEEGWRTIVMRPGASPFTALAARLHPAGLPSSVAEIVPALTPNESLVLVVDQFEELVTLCADAEVREAFAQSLVDAAMHPSGRLRVVVTLRDDFLIRIQSLSALRERMSSTLQLLGTPAKEELLRVLTEPARRVGFTFDDDALPQKMVDEVSAYPGALALLSFTASQLWELRDRHLRQMRAKTYEALGGVGGALAHHAELTLSEMNDAAKALVREAFRHLVTSQGTRVVLTKREVADVLGGHPETERVLEKLITARLLVTSEDDRGEDRIEIIHEALVSSWPRLVGWQREDAETARFRDALRSSARQWEQRGRPRGLLWREETLAEYRTWRKRYLGRLTSAEEAFAEASLNDERRGRRARQAIAAAIALGLVLGIIFLARANRTAEESREKVRATLLQSREEQVRTAHIGGRSLEAREGLRTAANEGFDTPLLRELSAQVEYKLRGGGQVLEQRKAAAYSMRWVGEVLVTLWADNTLSFQRAGTQTATLSLPCDVMRVLGTTGQLALGCLDGVVRIIDPQKPNEVPVVIPIGKEGVYSLDSSADGARLLVFFGDQLASVNTEERSVKPLARFENLSMLLVRTHRTGTVSALFAGPSPSWAKTFRGLTLVSDDKRVVQLLPNEIVTVARFTENQIIAATSTGEIVALLLSDHSVAWRMRVSSEKIEQLECDSHQRIVVAQTSHALNAIDIETGKIIFSEFLGDRITAIHIVAEPARVAIGMDSGAIRLYELPEGALMWSFVGHTQAVTTLISRDGVLSSTSIDGTVRRWDVLTASTKRIWFESPVLALNTDRFEAGAIVATTTGIFEVDGENTAPKMIKSMNLEPNASITLSKSSLGEIVVVRGKKVTVLNRREEHSGQVPTWELTDQPVEAAFSPDGRRIAFLIGASIDVFESKSGRQLHHISTQEESIFLGAFVLDSSFVACSSSGNLYWFALTGFTPPIDKVEQRHRDYCWLNQGKSGFVSYSYDGTVRWDQRPEFDMSELGRLANVSAVAPEAFSVAGHWLRWKDQKLVANDELPLPDPNSVQFDGVGNLWFIDGKGVVRYRQRTDRH